MTTKFYKPFKNVSPESSASSYGRWMVRISEVTFKFFWRKAEAQKYADAHNATVE